MKPPNIRATKAGCRVQRAFMLSPTNLVGQVGEIRGQVDHRRVLYNRPVHIYEEIMHCIRKLFTVDIGGHHECTQFER